ncbi:uncharacterized protein LOC122508908 [Leptopilina heterotoma]|uniref:uncharacterized protein LOC122508908 n=1 Tax=Leptopilina heterotoma TaxID=63436 RepID=UPI001CA9EFD3|nr:uncharacterized protein LOC122508908 [Leptopilina heterotoma]
MSCKLLLSKGKKPSGNSFVSNETVDDNLIFNQNNNVIPIEHFPETDTRSSLLTSTVDHQEFVGDIGFVTNSPMIVTYLTKCNFCPGVDEIGIEIEEALIQNNIVNNTYQQNGLILTDLL